VLETVSLLAGEAFFLHSSSGKEVDVFPLGNMEVWYRRKVELRLRELLRDPLPRRTSTYPTRPAKETDMNTHGPISLRTPACSSTMKVLAETRTNFGAKGRMGRIFSAGEPDFPRRIIIKQAAIRAD